MHALLNFPVRWNKDSWKWWWTCSDKKSGDAHQRKLGGRKRSCELNGDRRQITSQLHTVDNRKRCTYLSKRKRLQVEGNLFDWCFLSQHQKTANKQKHSRKASGLPFTYKSQYSINNSTKDCRKKWPGKMQHNHSLVLLVEEVRGEQWIRPGHCPGMRATLSDLTAALPEEDGTWVLEGYWTSCQHILPNDTDPPHLHLAC